jgi:hypothetical protein
LIEQKSSVEEESAHLILTSMWSWGHYISFPMQKPGRREDEPVIILPSENLKIQKFTTSEPLLHNLENGSHLIYG